MVNKIKGNNFSLVVKIILNCKIFTFPVYDFKSVVIFSPYISNLQDFSVFIHKIPSKI